MISPLKLKALAEPSEDKIYPVKIEDASYKFDHMLTLSSANYHRCTAMHATVETSSY